MVRLQTVVDFYDKRGSKRTWQVYKTVYNYSRQPTTMFLNVLIYAQEMNIGTLLENSWFLEVIQKENMFNFTGEA